MSSILDIAQLTDQLMRRIHSDLNSKAESFDQHGVGPVGGMLLFTIRDLEPTPIHNLCTALARDKSQVTRLLNTLENKGLIERRPSPKDARSSEVTLTQLGQDATQGLQVALAETLGGITSGLTDEQRDQFKFLLTKIQAGSQNPLNP